MLPFFVSIALSGLVSKDLSFLTLLLTNSLGSFSNHDGDGNEDLKKAIDRFVTQNNNFARESPFFVHLFTVLAPLRRENA